MEQDPTISELFPATKALPSLKEIDNGLGGLKNLIPSASSDSKSREAKKNNGKRKSKGTGNSSDTNGD